MCSTVKDSESLARILHNCHILTVQVIKLNVISFPHIRLFTFQGHYFSKNCRMAEYNSFQNCCRICRENRAGVHNIFDEFYNGQRLVDMLEYCLQYPVNTSEQYPDTICAECSSNLIVTYEFFVLFKKSEEYFQNCIDEVVKTPNQIKIELVNVPDTNETSLDYIKIEPSIETNIDVSVDEGKQITCEPLLECSNNEILGNNGIESSVVRRRRSRKPGKIQQCTECEKSFMTISALKQHLVSHSTERPHACTQCPRKFKRERELKIHALLHLDERSFACDRCDSRFNSHPELKHHMETHSDEKCKFRRFLSCNLFLQFTQISLFFHTVTTYSCEICDRSYRNVKSKEKHMNKHFGETHRSKEPGTVIYECFDCKKSFGKLRDLYRHIKEHNIGRTITFKCSFCELFYPNLRAMFQHKKLKHTLYVHDCDYCDQSFRATAELKAHVRKSHRHELNSFKCNQCSKSFSLKCALNTHLETHLPYRVNPKKSQLCSECGKSFKSISSLKLHLVTHSEDKPYACTQCPSKFRTKGQLKTHFVVHTDERNIDCNVCGKAFKTTTSLAMHMCKC